MTADPFIRPGSWLKVQRKQRAGMSWIRLFSADRLFHYFGPAPLHLMTRLVGILLFALAIDFVLEGVRRTFT